MKYRHFTFLLLLLHSMLLTRLEADAGTTERAEYNARIVERRFPELRSGKLRELAAEESRKLFASNVIDSASAVDFFADLRATGVLYEALPLLGSPTVKFYAVRALLALSPLGDTELVKALVRDARFFNETGPVVGGSEDKILRAQYQRFLLGELGKQTGLDLEGVDMDSKKEISAAIVRVEEWLDTK